MYIDPSSDVPGMTMIVVYAEAIPNTKNSNPHGFHTSVFCFKKNPERPIQTTVRKNNRVCTVLEKKSACFRLL